MTIERPARRPSPSAARCLALAALMAAPRAAAAQQEMVTIAAGPEYAADRFHEYLLGTDYRPLWATPIRVPVLDLERFAGGLEPTERGGGRQTRGLRFLGADGRIYQFRSVNKWPSTADEPAIQGTVIARLLQDQVSSLHPAAPVVAARIAEAAGVLHSIPQFVVMPDDPALGEFREEFAGMLGTIEERADEVEGSEGPFFGGFHRITGTERLLERLAEGPDDRVDQRAYLRARLVDLLLGDWDRHPGQWRWGESEAVAGMDLWIPIARDRDFALVDYDGSLLDLARLVVENAVLFGPEIDDLTGLTLNARMLDRSLLSELTRAEWEAIALDIQGRLSDEAIAAAVRSMPAEYHPLSAEDLEAKLRARRDDLPGAAARLYRMFAQAVDVFATDAADVARVHRLADGSVEVQLFGHDEDDGRLRDSPYFQRIFEPGETDEVRVFLMGGDDRGVVTGEARRGPVVRFVGGGGDDVLADSSTVRARRPQTAFYDHEGDNRFLRGRRTRVDTRPYEPPAVSPTVSGESFRDWGRKVGLSPYVDYKSTEGLILGGGPTLTQYGFRQIPYSHRIGVRAMVGLESWGLGADFFADFRSVNSPVALSLRARASQLESFKFFGYGNDTPFAASDRTRVPQDQVRLEAALTVSLLGDARLALGPVAKYSRPELLQGTVLAETRPLGSDEFGQAGVQAEAWLDRRDSDVFPRRGFQLVSEGALYPAAWDAASTFGRMLVEGSTYLGIPLPLDPVLALRAGGERVWGEFPVHEAVFLGGSGSIRGFNYQRFAGDTGLYGGAELRARLMPLELIVNGDLGMLALAETGRVFLDGESDGGWHTGLGVGLWFAFTLRDQNTVASLTYARGERDAFYVKMGVPF